MLSQWLAVAAGGALGATARYGLSTAIYQSLGKSFPYGTLAVNVIGCLLIGLASVHWIERVTFGDTWRLFLIIGVFGGFTTFSTFSLETIQLLQQGEPGKALANIGVSLIACLAATYVGWLIVRSSALT
jgi:CrcB protein